MALRWKTPISLLLGLAVALPLGSSATTAAEPTASEIDDAIDFRASHGFPDSRTLVESSYGDPEAFPDTHWGVPLTEDEAADLLRRLELRAGQDDAIQYALDQPEFAGVWFDQLDGGAGHYTFTANVAAHRAVILELAPAAAKVHVTTADHRMSALDAIKEGITDDMWTLIDEGMPISMVDANARANRVIVYLTEPRDGAQDLLRERYGGAVITELGAAGVPDCDGTPPFDRDNCRPMKGGLRIVHGPSGDDCSSAFQAERANGDRVVITAGHCLNEHGGADEVWKHNNNQFGLSQGDTIDSSTEVADIGWIKIDASEDITPANRFFAASATDIRSITGVRLSNYQVEQDDICRSGEQSHWDCGVITNTDASKPNGEGQTITSVWVWSKDSLAGDSGGTMIYPIMVMGVEEYYAAGLHVHSVTVPCGGQGQPLCRSWYSMAQQVQNPNITNGVDLTICTSSGC